MEFIRLIKWEKNQYDQDVIADIYEFEGGISQGQVFRSSSGTCTRLFSRKLRECIEQGTYVTIEKGER